VRPIYAALLLLLLLPAPAAAAAPCLYLRFPGYHIEGVDTDGNGVYELVVELIHWNLVSARGVSVIRYCLSNQTYHYYQDLRDIVYREETVFGYPELYYGYKPWSRWGAYEGEVDLPSKVSEVPRFWVVANYSFTHQEGLPVDVATDSWITYAWKPGRVGQGDAEIMIWFYHSNLVPAGRRIATVKCPTYINGRLLDAVYEVWHAEFEWRYIAFVLDPPLRRGSVAVDFSCILENAARLIDIHGSMYLNDVELGVEYGLPGHTRAAFRWDVYRFYVTTHDPETPLNATVRAASSNGTPIPGLPVTLQGMHAGETGGDGSYRLRLKPGLYTVEVPLHYVGGGLNCTFRGWVDGSRENYTLLAPGFKSIAEAVYDCSTTREEPEPGGATGTVEQHGPNLTLSVELVNASGHVVSYSLLIENTGDAAANATIEVHVEPIAGVVGPESVALEPGSERRVNYTIYLPSPGSYTIVFRVEYGDVILERRVEAAYKPQPVPAPAKPGGGSVNESGAGAESGGAAPGGPEPSSWRLSWLYYLGAAVAVAAVAVLVAARRLGKV